MSHPHYIPGLTGPDLTMRGWLLSEVEAMIRGTVPGWLVDAQRASVLYVLPAAAAMLPVIWSDVRWYWGILLWACTAVHLPVLVFRMSVIFYFRFNNTIRACRGYSDPRVRRCVVLGLLAIFVVPATLAGIAVAALSLESVSPWWRALLFAGWIIVPVLVTSAMTTREFAAFTSRSRGATVASDHQGRIE